MANHQRSRLVEPLFFAKRKNAVCTTGIMQFLDNLILGSNTPRYADEALFPSRTYKKLVCNKKHCSTMCTTKLFVEFEFWAYVLSEKKLNRGEIRKSICTMNKDLRFSVWIKCTKCRDEEIELKPIKPENPENGKEESPPNMHTMDSKGLSDKDLVAFILEMCKEADQNNEEAIFNILKNLEMKFSEISNPKLLALFIKHILELPYAEPLLAYRFIYVLMRSYNLHSIFTEDMVSDASNAEENTNEEKDLETNGNTLYTDFWRVFISEHPSVFNQVVDLLLCYENADIAAIPRYIQTQTRCSDSERWIKFISVRSNLERLDGLFEEKGQCVAIDPEDKGQETYFDFLIVQNELIKAQEAMRTELSGRICDLERERDELYLQKDNLVNACKSLEAELKEYQEGYVNEVKKMFYDVKSQCEKYEKENMELRSKLYGTKDKR